MNTKTMKTGWFKTAMAVVAVSIAALGAYGAEMITVDKVSNHYPWDGKVDCVYTLSGLNDDGFEAAYKCAFTLSVEQGGATVSKTVNTYHQSITGGTFTNTFDCTELFGAGVYPNGGIVAKLVRTDHVQLWAGGPYFALRNVGATYSTDAGYFFWWGDTTGYTYYGNAWHSTASGATIGFWEGAPANSACMSQAELLSNGWIDSTGNLAPAHDAARVKWGAPWRMPTRAEMDTLANPNVCQTWWVSRGGTCGRAVRGVTKGYEKHQIFIPETGYGWGSGRETDESGLWSSTPSEDYRISPYLCFNGSSLYRTSAYRWVGYPVRPVRSAE